jgi:hypothetical protein
VFLGSGATGLEFSIPTFTALTVVPQEADDSGDDEPLARVVHGWFIGFILFVGSLERNFPASSSTDIGEAASASGVELSNFVSSCTRWAAAKFGVVSGGVTGRKIGEDGEIGNIFSFMGFKPLENIPVRLVICGLASPKRNS